MNRLTTEEEYPHGAEGRSADKLTGHWCRGVFEATACVEKLARYENTGLEPEQIRELDRLHLEKCQEVTALKKRPCWIPVEERMPDGGEDVLVCTGNGWILVAWYGTNRQSWHITPTGITHDDIIAWRPLPEPYRKEENTP